MGPERPNFQGLDRHLQIVNGACRGGKMEDILQFPGDMDILGNVVMVKFKMPFRKKMLDIGNGTRQEIVHSNHVKPFFQESIAKMRPDKSGRAGD